MSQTVEERFWSKVVRGTAAECWLWVGARTGAVGTRTRSAGNFNLGGRRLGAHRVAYELAVGPIPEGLTIDHLCGNPLCVNPSHLEAVSQAVNIRRGRGLSDEGRRDVCGRGHPLNEQNLYVWTGDGYRRCRACRAEDKRKRRRKRPEVTP